MLALTVLMGIASVAFTPEGGTAIGIWPVGLAVCTLFVARRAPTWLLLLLVWAIAVLTLAVARPTGFALVLGTALALETWLVWRILTGGARVRPTLHTFDDFARLLGASGAGAAIGAAGAVVGSLVSGWGSPGSLALAVFVSNLASQLPMIPFFSRLRHHENAAGRVERTVQWVLVVTVTPIVFFPSDYPSLVFLVLPLLGWGAMRIRPVEVLAQNFVALAVVILLSSFDHGPFANAGNRFGITPDAQGILLSLFIIVAALVVIPLMLSVGEQLENARQAAAERDRVKRIVDGITNVAIIGVDENQLVTLFNPGAERLLGYAEEEMLGRTTAHLHSQEAIAAKAAEFGVEPTFFAVARAIIDNGSTDMPFICRDGEVRMHSMSLNRVLDDRGQSVGVVSTSEDITSRVESERRLLESLEVQRQAVERLREVDQVKDAFVSSVSHELRTPITSILGYIEMLEDGTFGELDPRQLDAVQRVAGNSHRLLSLIDDLLTLSRVQEGGLGLADRVVDLRRVVEAGCAVVRPALEHRHVHFELDLPPDPVPFLGDRDMLERVVINLVGNAVKFTPADGRVGVRLLIYPDHAVIEVSDTGIGIPQDEQERLFSRFFRSSLAQQQAIPGSGLGLSIAHSIIEQHGGAMSVESEPGVGTTFRVSLPLIDAA